MKGGRGKCGDRDRDRERRWRENLKGGRDKCVGDKDRERERERERRWRENLKGRGRETNTNE